MRKLHDETKEGKDGRRYTKVAAKREKKKCDSTTKMNQDKDKLDKERREAMFAGCGSVVLLV